MEGPFARVLAGIPVTGVVSLSDHARGVVYVLGAATAFGTLGTLSGLAYRTGMSAPTFTALRAAIGAAILAALVLSGRRDAIDLRRLTSHERVMLGLAIVANATLNLALFAAYGAMSVALVLAIYFTYPLLVACASVALGRERVTRSRVAGLCLATAGLALVVGSQVGPGARISALGLLFAAVTAICQATYLVASRAGYTRVPSDQATGIILTCGAAMAAVVAFGADGAAVIGPWVGEPAAWAAVIVAGTLGAALAKVWLLRGVRRIGGTRTAVIMLGEPVVGVILAALVLGQDLTPLEILGGLAILAAAALVQRSAAGAAAPGVLIAPTPERTTGPLRP